MSQRKSRNRRARHFLRWDRYCARFGGELYPGNVVAYLRTRYVDGRRTWLGLNTGVYLDEA